MPTSPSPFEAVATVLKTLIDTEFAPENIVAVFDNIHGSLGTKGICVGIAPTEDLVHQNDRLVQETWIEIKFYDLWKKEIDPKTIVNPTRITAFAERLRVALREAGNGITDPGTGQVWFFQLMKITYPNDPTGNRSRFVATIRAWGNNSQLVETI